MLQVFLTLPAFTVIVAVPPPTPVTIPLSLTFATDVSDDEYVIVCDGVAVAFI